MPSLEFWLLCGAIALSVFVSLAVTLWKELEQGENDDL